MDQRLLQLELGEAYTITRELSGGGMSRVFLATDNKLGRAVVVKTLAREMAQGLSAERFQREIRLAARLQEPHIVPVISAGLANGVPYYTMPFVEGESLRARLTLGVLPIPEAVGILRDIATALEYAHAHDVVHRDIKPENVLLSGRTAMVADFGIAKALSAAKGETAAATDSSLTASGTTVGTPAYIAPEQAVGAAADHRSDIYSWGIVAYEVLAGAHPFEHRQGAQQLVAAHLTEAPRPLTERRPELPLEVCAVVERAMRKDPADRPGSARELLEALDAFATPGALRQVAPRRTRTRRRFVYVISAVIGVLALVGSAWVVDRARGARASADTPPRIAVLAFENLGAPGDKYFADGVTDEIRAKLAEVPGLRVMGRISSRSYEKTTKTPKQIGKELDVRYLLTGTVRKEASGDGPQSYRVHASLELVNTENGEVAWQQPIDAALTDVFAVQAEIARRVARSLDIALTSSTRRQLGHALTTNVAAYDAYLRGEAMSGSDAATLRRAIAAYEEAVALDSNFAEAWAGLSIQQSLLYSNSTPTAEGRENARRNAERAVTLAPNRPDGYHARAQYYTAVNDPERAYSEASIALSLAPRDPRAITNVARREQRLGRWTASLEHAREATRLEPRSADAWATLSLSLFYLRRYDEATRATDEALALDPRNLAWYERKIMLLVAQGKLDEARAAVRSPASTIAPVELAAFIATYYDLYWLLDDEMQRVLLRLTPTAFDNDGAFMGLVFAETYALRGDRERSRAYADSARVTYEQQLRMTPSDAQRHVLLGLVLAYLGLHGAAIAEGMRGTTLRPMSKDAYSGAYLQHQLVRIYLLVGEREKALDALEPLLERPYYLSPAWLRIDPTFAPLRGEPRFERMVR